MLRKMFTMMVLLAVVACGSQHDAPAPTPNLLGTWSGTYISSSNAGFSFSINIEINQQISDTFTGAWKLSTSNDWPADSIVEGYTYPSNDGRSLVDFSLTSGGMISCFSPLFGWFEHPQESLSVFGYLTNNAVTDLNAYYRYGCSTADSGEITLTLQPSL